MKAELLVGATVAATPENVLLDRDVLTTHGVILGMTGSGKTGLAIVLLEELARKGVPLVICDLKGDMTNLLLNFPALAPADFAPYLPATQAGGDRDAAAQAVAAKWRDGLAKWSLGEQQMREVRDGVDWRLLTPGSGVAPVSLLSALRMPDGYRDGDDLDGARIRLDGTTAGLLALVGRGEAQSSDRDHVLLATLIDLAWRNAESPTFETLALQITQPPIAKFGVLDVETFYPRKERDELFQAFNAVLASPSFRVWMQGAPLTIEELIGASGAPRATILYLAHLAERERMSFLTLLTSSLLSWTRSQSGSDSLRVLLYLDEVQGILPPVAIPPTKPPLLTLLKQGRAFGAGVLLATQNPVDLDYKALGNIGFKAIGRLDTERDRKHALEGLDSADATTEKQVTALEQRQFLLTGMRTGAPRIISSRWAMSYLRGPLTLVELKRLPALKDRSLASLSPSQESAAPAQAVLAGVKQLFARGSQLEPYVLVKAQVIYRRTTPLIERPIEGSWCAPFRETGEVGIDWAKLARLDDHNLGDKLGEGVTLAPLPLNAATTLELAPREFSAEIDSRAIEVAWHRTLKLVQEEGEPLSLFEERCRRAAPSGAGRDAEVRRRFEDKLRRVDEKLAKERLELADDEREATARSREKTMAVATGIGEAVLGALFGRRGGLGSLARRGASTARTYGSKDRMADRAEADVEESRQTIAQLEDEKRRLGEELEQELATLSETGAGSGIETLRLTPARKDITVRRVALAWLPKGE